MMTKHWLKGKRKDQIKDRGSWREFKNTFKTLSDYFHPPVFLTFSSFTLFMFSFILFFLLDSHTFDMIKVVRDFDKSTSYQ